ncbi:MAG: hypothetical protein J5978_08015 [Spirochaetaceae bacterium]|nr:hypothetical protein [Spirochaetaceae bacterium]
MKKKIFGMMILALLVLSFGLLSCKQEVSNDTNGGGNSNPFIGTWKGEGDEGSICKIVFTQNGNFTAYYDDEISGAGSYTYDGKNATLFFEEESFTIVINDGGFYAWSIWLEKQ